MWYVVNRGWLLSKDLFCGVLDSVADIKPVTLNKAVMIGGENPSVLSQQEGADVILCKCKNESFSECTQFETKCIKSLLIKKRWTNFNRIN